MLRRKLTVEPYNFDYPQITDEDVAWVCDILKLPAAAFSGSDGADPRLDVLKSMQTLDIEACPGSGKTTLLVAKLAILARKWPSARQGLCVLSHTNVARREIEERLGNSAVGRNLLAFPHFVGTIHGFVNEFLAIPWLRSLGYPVSVIDDRLCEQHRRRILEQSRFSALSNYVRHKEESSSTIELNVISKWQVASSAFDVVKRDGKPEFKDATGTSAVQLRTLATQCAKDGYHRFDEMFVWANDLLDRYPSTKSALRRRFPLLFIDEVQDNNEAQSRILHRSFMEGEQPAKRQRYGDSNQAIYGYAGEKGAATDRFPIATLRRDIPNSHRFGQQIADFTRPLGLVPQALVGCGPHADASFSNTTGLHTIFLFCDQTIQRVIPTYADYLCSAFSAEELNEGDFTVVAAVHKPGAQDNVPRFLGQYWPAYDYELAPSDPKPKSFCGFVMAGRKESEQSGETHPLVEKIAEGILRLVRLSYPGIPLRSRRRKHRYVMELLENDSKSANGYRSFVKRIAADRLGITSVDWRETWLPVITCVAEAIGKAQLDSDRCASFLQWEETIHGQVGGVSLPRDNVFHHPVENPAVRLRVGSIHSAKGETHTATLVLDTYNDGHHLRTLRPWLLGTKTGKGTEGVQNQSRLKQHYVAMTRPAHLLCLAMREDAFSTEEIGLLKERHWRVGRVRDGAPEWL